MDEDKNTTGVSNDESNEDEENEPSAHEEQTEEYDTEPDIIRYNASSIEEDSTSENRVPSISNTSSETQTTQQNTKIKHATNHVTPGNIEASARDDNIVEQNNNKNEYDNIVNSTQMMTETEDGTKRVQIKLNNDLHTDENTNGEKEEERTDQEWDRDY
eukprot:14187056-Ditylum_brightwellii.AAC.1